MKGKLPRVTAVKVIKALERVGFSLARQSGSNKIYKNKEGKRVTIPYHVGRTLHPKVLKSILRDADMRYEELKELMK
jgi:predicted RNA binding protein YcfA (HicA-like mRNA interferase family)